MRIQDLTKTECNNNKYNKNKKNNNEINNIKSFLFRFLRKCNPEFFVLTLKFLCVIIG